MIEELKNEIIKYLKPLIMNKYVMNSSNPNFWISLEVIFVIGLFLLIFFIIIDMFWDMKKGLGRMAE